MSEFQNEASNKKQKLDDGDDSTDKITSIKSQDSLTSKTEVLLATNDPLRGGIKASTSEQVIATEAEESAIVSTSVTATTSTTTTTTAITSNVTGEEDKQEEDEEEPSVTVYCDDCDKARILKPEFASTFNLSERWTCSQACVKGCAQVDDELGRIAGEMFATVLDAAGIKTRRQLAAADEEEFDAGPWGAYIASWISQARSEENFDALVEICGDHDLAVQLVEIGINSPLRLLLVEDKMLLESLLEIGQLEQYEDSIQDSIQIWRMGARSVIEEFPWMNDE